MSDEIQQGKDAADAVVNNLPWFIAVLAPVAELYRRTFKSATKDEVQTATMRLWEGLDQNRRESDTKIEQCHTQLREDITQSREDIKAVGRQVADLTTHLLRRREDRE